MVLIITDPRLDKHIQAVPIDHPDDSVTYTKISVPLTVTVPLEFQLFRYGVQYVIGTPSTDHRFIARPGSLTDASTLHVSTGGLRVALRMDFTNKNGYTVEINTPLATKDFGLFKWSSGVATQIGYEAVDLSVVIYTIASSVGGSTFKGFRDDLTTPKFTVTDTSYAAGQFALGESNGLAYFPYAYSMGPPMTNLPQALAIAEFDIVGSGRYPDDPYRPAFTENLVDASSLDGVPDFLKLEARRYELLKSKGFTDDEIKLLLGYTPQTKVDVNAVTWGAFDFNPGKASTVLVIIKGDNPYQPGAIDRQSGGTTRRGLRGFIDRVLGRSYGKIKPPKSYDEAVAQYNQLKRNHPEWLAGKDDYAYQTLGYEELEPLAVADFYYGFLIDHQTEPQRSQIRQVPDWELRNTINMWLGRLEKAKPKLKPDEYEKHRKKLDDVLRVGW